MCKNIYLKAAKQNITYKECFFFLSFEEQFCIKQIVSAFVYNMFKTNSTEKNIFLKIYI